MSSHTGVRTLFLTSLISVLVASSPLGAETPVVRPAPPMFPVATEPHPSAVSAARGLLKRLLPEHTDEFRFEAIPSARGRDVFEIESAGGKTVVRGNNGVAMAMGLNTYLREYCRADTSMFGRRLTLPDPLPPVDGKVRRVTWARYRYFLNYCCFGYSLPWWHWEQWEQLVDWMALNGINMPLSVTGQEAVWQDVCKRLELSDAQVTEFLAGPPYLPFSWMGCLDGWGGPLPQSWIDGHAELQKKILARQRELGMTPVLQGFTGHIPPGIAEKFPDAKVHQIRWIEWETNLLDPLDPLYPRISRVFLEEQTKRFGTDHLYAADTFIEMTPPSGDLKFLADLSRAIYRGMADVDPEAVWVLQGWAFMFQQKFWTQPRIRAVLDAVDDERMVILDLYCEARPMWNQTEAFCGKPWVWCNIQNFGGRVFLGGQLQGIHQNLPAAKLDANRGKLVGLGFVNEALGNNPVVFDRMFESAWEDRPRELAKWYDEYAHRRYGRRSESAERCWRLLADTVYSTTMDARSTIDNVPSLRAASRPPYDQLRLARAWGELLEAADELGDADTYRYDLVNLARQVLSNHAANLLQQVATAHRSGSSEQFAAASARFLQLIRELDALLATRHDFLLGRTLDDAKRWGTSDAESARLEWNARRVLTLWGTGKAIRDYAGKEWSGMLIGFYLPRWKQYLDAVGKSLETEEPFDDKAFYARLLAWEGAWADQRESYPTEPRGDSVAVAKRLWAKYREAFRPPPPDAVSLTTGKPVTCSTALPQFPARLANDGFAADTNRYWAMDVSSGHEPWWQVDLEKSTTVGRVVVVGFYGDSRRYGFTVETSIDGKQWDLVADRREKPELSTSAGYTCPFAPRPVRYIRVTQSYNSANTGRHLVEVMAFAE